METDKDMKEDPPQRRDRMFTAEDVPKIVKLFEEADEDGGGGLDMEEFYVAMEKLYGNITKEEVVALHMQIDTNCDGTVDLNELLTFLLTKTLATKDNDKKPFPRPFKKIPVDTCHKPIIRMIFHPFKNDVEHNQESEVSGQDRPYQKGQYHSISSNGCLTFWTDAFDRKTTIDLRRYEETLPLSHVKKIRVTDMVYIRELQQLAISTSDRELIFYKYDENQRTTTISHALIIEESIVNTMNYWSDGTKAVFSFGDIGGRLSMFISNNIKKNGLFSKSAFEEISLKKYNTVLVSSLLRDPSKNFKCFKIPIFNDVCRQVRYFPTLDSFAICGDSAKTMVLVTLTKTDEGSTYTKVTKKVFSSPRYKESFTCVEYSHSMKCLVTGGIDGSLRVWSPFKTVSCEWELPGHVKPITHIEFNPDLKIFVSLSKDKNVRVWSEDGWLCRQSFYIQDMGPSPISSMCYNIHNNELVVANKDISKCLGKGTDVFKAMLTSHDKPLCSALYHNIFKQVVSVCQNGVVLVWDVLTGKAVLQFKVTPDQQVGLTAISFDGPKRRLITISQDGKVKLWNFNNGTELEALPVTVPNEVTGIVCIDNRVFVSGRNSKRIFDLDVETYDNRFLKHAYLDDISSMDVHEDTLVTASSNGNIVIWDATTAEALYWINANKSPLTNMAGKSVQGHAGSLQVKKNQKSVQATKGKSPHAKSAPLTNVYVSPLIICLKTRQARPDTATLLTSADGYICAWSVKIKGGLLGKFRAVRDEGVVTSMTTDDDEQILLTGDSTGRINLWDLRKFGIKKQSDEGPFEKMKGWCVSLCPPPLLRSWQAHPTGVVSVQCDPACRNIITAGLDCNVYLWTNTGSCIGLFGRDVWDAEKVTTANSQILFPVPQMSSPLQTVNDNLLKTGTTPETVPTPAHDEGAMDIKPQQDQEDKNSTQQSAKEVQQGSKNASRPCPPSSTPSTYHTDATKGSAHMTPPASRTSKQKYFTPISDTGKLTKSSLDTQQSAGAVKQQSEHTSKKVHFPQLKPHPPKTPLIRGATGLKQSSPQTTSSYRNQTKSKYGRVLKIQPGQTFEAKGPTSGPRVILLDQRGSDHVSKYVHLPSIPDKVQLTHQTQFKPHLLRTLPTTGCTNATKSSLHIQQSAGAVKQQSEHTSKHTHPPPILDAAQLTRSQSQLKPHPPKTPLIRGASDLQQSSPQTTSSNLNQTKSKYGRVLKIQQGQTLQDSFPTPGPRVIMSGQHGSDHVSKHVHLPSIPDKVQLTHQTQFKPHPPRPCSLQASQTLLRAHQDSVGQERRPVPEDHSNN